MVATGAWRGSTPARPCRNLKNWPACRFNAVLSPSMANGSGPIIGTQIGLFVSISHLNPRRSPVMRAPKKGIVRKVTFGGACSLDGFFARKDDAVDWLMPSDEAAELMREHWKTIDTIVM